MKQYIFTLCLFCTLAAQATPDPVPTVNKAAAKTRVMNTGAIRFQFSSTCAGLAHKDSVLIIFDRYDRTGAGVIYKVFAQNDDNSITIPEVPAGKYYVTIQFLGVHRDRLEKLVRIKANKHGKMVLALEATEAFSPNNVVIPDYRPNFSDLAILKSR
jgi:hypothetical protein